MQTVPITGHISAIVPKKLQDMTILFWKCAGCRREILFAGRIFVKQFSKKSFLWADCVRSAEIVNGIIFAVKNPSVVESAVGFVFV